MLIVVVHFGARDTSLDFNSTNQNISLPKIVMNIDTGVQCTEV